MARMTRTTDKLAAAAWQYNLQIAIAIGANRNLAPDLAIWLTSAKGEHRIHVACQWRLHLCVASFLLQREDIVSKALLYICVWTAMLPSDENPMHFHN